MPSTEMPAQTKAPEDTSVVRNDVNVRYRTIETASLITDSPYLHTCQRSFVMDPAQLACSHTTCELLRYVHERTQAQRNLERTKLRQCADRVNCSDQCAKRECFLWSICASNRERWVHNA